MGKVKMDIMLRQAAHRHSMAANTENGVGALS